MKTFLKITGMVVVYLGVAALGVMLTLPKPPIEISHAQENTPKNISVLIVPHHLVAHEYIRAGFNKVAQSRSQPKRIILMGPNHFFAGSGQVITETGSFKTAFGSLNTDDRFIQLLAEKNFASLEEEIPGADHAITAPIPFIKEFFPQATVVPLLMREPMSYKDTQTFGLFLAKNLTADDLIVASIDFSHYLPKKIADQHDKESLVALRSLDTDFFKEKIDADSPQILMTLSYYLKEIGQTRFEFLSHTNSGDLVGNPYETSTTSHIVGFYHKGI